jgi:hypothetical protein
MEQPGFVLVFNMRNKKSIKEKFSIQLNYIIVVLGIIVLISLGIYALPSGVAPNPGHFISEVSPPSGCAAGQLLQWNGATWTCINANVGCPSGTHIATSTYTNELEDTYGSPTFMGYSPSCSSPTDTCDGDQNNAYTCLTSDSKTCIDVYKTPTGGIAPYTCTKRTITCKKAAMLCEE